MWPFKKRQCECEKQTEQVLPDHYKERIYNALGDNKATFSIYIRGSLYDTLTDFIISLVSVNNLVEDIVLIEHVVREGNNSWLTYKVIYKEQHYPEPPKVSMGSLHTITEAPSKWKMIAEVLEAVENKLPEYKLDLPIDSINFSEVIDRIYQGIEDEYGDTVDVLCTKSSIAGYSYLTFKFTYKEPKQQLSKKDFERELTDLCCRYVDTLEDKLKQGLLLDDFYVNLDMLPLRMLGKKDPIGYRPRVSVEESYKLLEE